jgi:hypothetical protein
MESQPDVIDVGCQVELILRDREGKPEPLTIVIVTPAAADFSHGYLGLNTPLAQSLLGEKVGAIIPYLRDDIYSIEVITVTKSSAQPPEDAVRKREASIKKATRAVQDTNAILFASSFSGKWGDYDPDSLPKDTKPDDSQE